MIPTDALCQARYDDLTHAKLALRQFRRCEAALYRVRWVPVATWPEHPWAVIAYPFWRRWEADAISPLGEVIQPNLASYLWRCPEPGCGANWLAGLSCPRCGGIIPRDQWPPLEPSTEPTTVVFV